MKDLNGTAIRYRWLLGDLAHILCCVLCAQEMRVGLPVLPVDLREKHLDARWAA